MAAILQLTFVIHSNFTCILLSSKVGEIMKTQWADAEQTTTVEACLLPQPIFLSIPCLCMWVSVDACA